MRILHVTECYAGGVSRAMLARVSSYPEAEHHLLWSGDESPAADGLWSSVAPLPVPLLARVKAIQARADEINADLVHAHSSWAGVYTRARRLSVPLVYEPHCFKHDDPNTPRPLRKIYKSAEAFFARRTWKFGALSSHEANLVKDLDPHAQIVLLPNLPSVRARPAIEAQGDHTDRRNPVTITTVGRIAPQKDPEYFIRVANKVRELMPEVQFLWVGDGVPELRKKLVRAGIKVTGWLDSDTVARTLSHSNVYMHTAAYEGFPLSVLDAAACMTPIVARCIPAFEDTELLQANSPSEFAHLVTLVLSDSDMARRAKAANQELLSRMNEEQLRTSLQELYTHKQD